MSDEDDEVYKDASCDDQDNDADDDTDDGLAHDYLCPVASWLCRSCFNCNSGGSRDTAVAAISRVVRSTVVHLCV